MIFLRSPHVLSWSESSYAARLIGIDIRCMLKTDRDTSSHQKCS